MATHYTSIYYIIVYVTLLLSNKIIFGDKRIEMLVGGCNVNVNVCNV